MPLQWNDKIFGVGEQDFEALALELFRFQSENNPVYSAYINAIGINPEAVTSLTKVPFLPVRFFKSHEIRTTAPTTIGIEQAVVFESSGTTGSINSRHYVKDLALYERSFLEGFESFYGKTDEWCIIGLLPSYLERKNSSLVYMVKKLADLSGHSDSGFYLNEYDKLAELLMKLEKAGQKTLLIGVTFALLDFAERCQVPLKHTVIMETGGMKGRREEMIRDEVHAILKNAFAVSHIHSEYGMTELMSQAYSKGDGIFNCPPWMKILVRDEEDPFMVRMPGLQTAASVSGTINVVDLANIWSCCFIATDDTAKLHADGRFEVLGRVDGSDMRGCSLMVV